MTAEQVVADAFSSHRGLLWGLSYRMLGVPADADEVVQDTFLRALESPPPRLDTPLRPWLVRVAMNLCRDRLRARRRREYVGPWLPGPAELDLPDAAPSAEARYGEAESATLAFLLACEALTPSQRAVLLLRDAVGMSGEETAEILGMSLPNVKTTLHRARKAMAGYEPGAPAGEAARQRNQAALLAFLGFLAAGDAESASRLLAADAVALADGGGVYLAARIPIVGARRVADVYAKLIARQSGSPPRAQLRVLNGAPTVLAAVADAPDRWAPRFTFSVDLDGEGKIKRVYSVLAPDKLAGIGALF